MISSSRNLQQIVHVILVILHCFVTGLCTELDSITSTQYLTSWEVIVPRRRLQVGIFQSSKHSSGVVKISGDGNVVVMNCEEEILWSSNVSTSQSFEHPSDSTIPRTRISENTRTGERVEATSWRSPWDPNFGNFSLGMNSGVIPQVYIWKGSRPYWQSGQWNGQTFIGVQYMYPVVSDGFNLVNNREGFKPNHREEWERGNWTSGCIGRRALQCEVKNKNNSEDSMYAYDTVIGCMSWSKMIDIQQFQSSGKDLYIRVAHSELDHYKNIKKIVIPVILGTHTLSVCLFICFTMMARRRGVKRKVVILLADRSAVYMEELPVFSLDMLANATSQFHEDNKLGQGGFGPVYKDGKEIAVKRLSKASRQGLEEFMNEVLVISKVQHRNLVRLLRCYEGHRGILDWIRRSIIIEGVGRGLLYLHKDSRLKIIDRDLKPSNILLDNNFNPKISDFVMARIFGSDQDQADTRRVVGMEVMERRRFIKFRRSIHIESKHENGDQKMHAIGLLCVQEFAEDRPSISSILVILTTETTSLPAPLQPAFTERQRVCFFRMRNENRETRFTLNNISITNLTELKHQQVSTIEEAIVQAEALMDLFMQQQCTAVVATSSEGECDDSPCHQCHFGAT
ncbi:putative protein OBERON 3-like [Capsicum annuum]|nr:putative protein OBERON 3-like [Capsicum annuum]